MKATDLMVGDSIYRPDCYDKVVEIRLNGIIGQDSNRGLIPFDEIRPIEITPEILEKIGFKEVKHYYPYPTYEFRGIEQCVVRVAFPKDSNKTKYKKPFIEIDSEQCWIDHVDTEYFHELQHALRLCGIEKEIIL